MKDETRSIGENDYRRIKVMQDTIECCRVGGYAISRDKIVALPLQDEVVGNTVFWHNSKNTSSIPRLPNHLRTRVDVVNADTVDAARELLKEGLHPAILNMASCWQPGGGALDGKATQEESLFRRSNLCLSLYPFDRDYARYAKFKFVEQKYPDRDECLAYKRETGGTVDTSRDCRAFLSKGIVFFKGGEVNGCPYLANPFRLDVISVAAIKNPTLVNHDGEMRLWYEDERFALRKIRTVFRMGLHNGNDALVLGAWGCGAYHNPPKHIAELFKRVMNEPEFKDKYKNVTFAILSRDRFSRNLDVFKRVLL